MFTADAVDAGPAAGPQPESDLLRGVNVSIEERGTKLRLLPNLQGAEGFARRKGGRDTVNQFVALLLPEFDERSFMGPDALRQGRRVRSGSGWGQARVGRGY